MYVINAFSLLLISVTNVQEFFFFFFFLNFILYIVEYGSVPSLFFSGAVLFFFFFWRTQWCCVTYKNICIGSSFIGFHQTFMSVLF